MTQNKASLLASLQRLSHKQRITQTKSRKAETRTKIQLGDLMIQSGLTDLLNIYPGDDLQLQETHFSKVAILLGALIDAAEFVEERSHEWDIRGRKNIKHTFFIAPPSQPSP